MKMVYAIVHSEDGDSVTEALMSHGYIVTKLATTGGFLRRGNTTLLIGVEQDKVQNVIDIIVKESGKREQIVYNLPYSQTSGVPITSYNAVPTTVDVGGATIFVIDVERFEKV